MRTTPMTLPVLAVLLGSLLLAGCSGVASDNGTRPAANDGAGSPPSSATVTLPIPPVASGAVPRTAGGPSTAELAAMKSQLDAMQKEIDAIDLPSDDFSGAEGAVY